MQHTAGPPGGYPDADDPLGLNASIGQILGGKTKFLHVEGVAVCDLAKRMNLDTIVLKDDSGHTYPKKIGGSVICYGGVPYACNFQYKSDIKQEVPNATDEELEEITEMVAKCAYAHERGHIDDSTNACSTEDPGSITAPKWSGLGMSEEEGLESELRRGAEEVDCLGNHTCKTQACRVYKKKRIKTLMEFLRKTEEALDALQNGR